MIYIHEIIGMISIYNLIPKVFRPLTGDDRLSVGMLRALHRAGITENNLRQLRALEPVLQLLQLAGVAQRHQLRPELPHLRRGGFGRP